MQHLSLRRLHRPLASLLIFSLAGCGLLRLNMNGKTLIPGRTQPDPSSATATDRVSSNIDTDAAPASSKAAPPQANVPIVAQAKSSSARAQAPAPANLPVLRLAPGRAMVSLPYGPIAFSASMYKEFHIDGSGDCSYGKVSPVPTAYVDSQTLTATTRISLVAADSRGFLLRNETGQWHLHCESTLAQPEGGWPKGRIAIHPVSYRSGAPSQGGVLFLDDPQLRVTDRATQTLTFAQKLAQPRFVTVKVRNARFVGTDKLYGDGCERAAFADVPDLIIKTTRPIPGLTIMPLAAGAEVALRLRDGNATRCPKSNAVAPRWAAPSHFQLNEEGSYEVFVGGYGNEQPGEVTLMISDLSTKFDDFAPITLPPQAYDNRWLARAFPQLRFEILKNHESSSLRAVATLFERAPQPLFVYINRALEQDMVKGGFMPGQVPQLGEPLLVFWPSREKGDPVTVLTADGAQFDVPAEYLTATPPAQVTLPAAPRALDPHTDIFDLHALADSATLTRFTAIEDAWKACRGRAWAPFERQLPRISIKSGSRVIEVKNARYHQIEDAGERAMDKACGTYAQLRPKLDAVSAAVLTSVATTRQAMLAKVKARFSRQAASGSAPASATQRAD